MVIGLVFLIIGLSKVDISSFSILNLIFFSERRHFWGLLDKAACDFSVAGCPIAAFGTGAGNFFLSILQ
jgi:hypothetical protein